MESELVVKFSTRYEQEGARQALADLQRQRGAAAALGQSTTELDQKIARLNATLSQAKGGGKEGLLGGLKSGLAEIIPGFEKLEGVIGKLAGGALGALAATFAAIAGAIDLAKEGLKEFAAAQEKVAGLDAALAQTGQLTDEYREKLQELAEQLQSTTGVADDQWLGVLTRLTQFGADETNIEKYTNAVKNLAGLMGGDVQSAAHLLSRAMQGNFEAFSRYGIVVEDAGTKSEKLDKLFSQLATRGGGQLEASNRTLSGQFRQLGHVANDFLKAIGGLIASSGILQGILQSLIVAFEWWARVLGGVIPKVEGLNNAAAKSAASLDDAEKAAKQYALNLAGIKEEAEKGTAALEKQIAKVHALARAQDELLDAKMAQALAKIDQAEERGKMSPEAAIRLRGAARTSFGAARELAVDQAYKTEKEILEAKIESNKTEMMRLEERALAAERNKTDAEDFEKKRGALDQTYTGKIDYAEARFKEYKAGPQLFEDKRLGIRSGPRAIVEDDAIQATLQREIANAKTAREFVLRDWDKKSKATLASQSAKAKAARDEALAGQEAKAAENTRAQERIDEIDAAVAHGQALRNITRKTDAMVTGTAAEKEQKKIAEEKQRKDKQAVEEYEKRRNAGDPNAADSLPHGVPPPPAPVSPPTRPSGPDSWERTRQLQRGPLGSPGSLPYRPVDGEIRSAGEDVVAAIEASNQAVMDAFGKMARKVGELSSRLDNTRNV
jgi:hypothetical protein